ncbi:MAG: 1-acyl-sn-glycerol-3-phosphate acyltransferase [Ruminococcus sp.]|nr:1-acyl-sn-glycerol-3-phosphate acyltransferase [Ruminococcus sp.]
MKEPFIPVFYACDEDFAKYTSVSIRSLMDNASKDERYVIHILHTDIPETTRQTVLGMAGEGFEIRFVDVSDYLSSIAEKLPLRDYYSKTTYFRLFIAEMYPEYKKAIYIDSDTVVQGDISRLYAADTGDAWLGACHEQVMLRVDEFGNYVEKAIGVSRYNYFNAGVLLINCVQFREHGVLDKFIDYLNYYNFVVTQDEDYLNLICKDHVRWIDCRWNAEVFEGLPCPEEEAEIFHYIMANKPWHYENCPCGEIFWEYAKRTPYHDEIRAVLDAYTDEERENDRRVGEHLVQLAVKEAEREDNFLRRINRDKRAADRVEVLQRIEQYEREGRFGEDVEDDPPGRVLMPDEIEYIRKSRADKMKTTLAFKLARKFVNDLIKDKKLIIKEIKGIENFKSLDCGAVITCNHFNAFDSFAIQLAYDAAEQPSRTFWRVIREGNYTSFPGFYGMLMRSCNTLPLSSNFDTMKKFFAALSELLSGGHFVLFYPEQSMWWNYRKPKPLKRGAFACAVNNSAPVLPCFITMKDSDILGEDGFFVQEYTIHISPPIYPDKSLSKRKQAEDMMQRNYELWKEIYETEYQIPLYYTTAGEAEGC